MKTFSGRVAVITGAAGGFGLEFARLSAARGMKLVLADLRTDALEEAAAPLRAAGADVLTVATDVRHGEQVQALADAAIERFGAVHLLFNNAGVGSGGLIWENSERDWEWVLGVNLWGVIHGVRIFTPLMLNQAAKDADYEGHIVNTASMAGLLNAPALGVYNVSKHAVVSLSETLYHDLQYVGARIGASVLCPYFVPTGIAHSHQHRPDDVRTDQPVTPSQLLSQAMLAKAVASGKLTATDVAQLTFDAVAERRFYIYSHPQALRGVQQRFDDVLAQRNPSDPYADTPDIGALMRARLKPS